MSNRTYVCLDFRTTKRANAAYGEATEHRCPLCGVLLLGLDWRCRVPAKTADKAWKEFRGRYVGVKDIDEKISVLSGQSQTKSVKRAIFKIKTQRRKQTQLASSVRSLR